MNQFEYKGYMSQEAQDFFRGKTISEEREGCAVVGTFIILKNGQTCLPSKGDLFTKDEDGELSVVPVYKRN